MGKELSKHLSHYVNELSKRREVVELVRLMNPLDVAKIIQRGLDLQPKEAASLFANFVKKTGLNEWAVAGGGEGSYPVPNSNKKEVGLDEDFKDLAPTHDIDPNQFPPAPQANSGNDFPYDPQTTLTMDPRSKHKRPLETIGDGEPSDDQPDTEPGVSGVGTFQKNQGAQSKSGNMSTTGGTITVQGYPGWSSSPSGKLFNKDEEDAPKYNPIEVGEGLDDDDLHTTQDDSGMGGLLKAIAISFGGMNPDRKMGFRKK